MAMIFTSFMGVTRFNGGGKAIGFVAFRRQTLTADSVVEPVVQGPGINVGTLFGGVVGIPGTINPDAVAVQAAARVVAGSVGNAVAFLIGVASHQTDQVAIKTII